MDALNVFIRNHPVVTYFALTFAISGVTLLTYSFALAAAVWITVIVVGARSGWHLDHRAVPSAQRAA